MDYAFGTTEMATSSYLTPLLILVACYPVYIIVAHIMIYDEDYRTKQVRIVSVILFCIIGFLLYQHMQTEVEYGKPLLDLWYQNNPPANQ